MVDSWGWWFGLAHRMTRCQLVTGEGTIPDPLFPDGAPVKIARHGRLPTRSLCGRLGSLLADGRSTVIWHNLDAVLANTECIVQVSQAAR